MPNSLNLSRFSDEVISLLPDLMRMSRYVLGGRSDALTSGEISLPQYVAIELLVKNERIKMNEMARFLRISLPAATGLIDRLVALGLVERKRPESDRRVVYISATKKGKKTAEGIRFIRRQVIESAFRDLSEKERRIYLSILHKVKKALYEKARLK